uniref:Uncharacterized protein n=1 Tax=viral metagenome TaxID=1070528 RepID=A0A6M3J3M0_9ZZZZ
MYADHDEIQLKDEMNTEWVKKWRTHLAEKDVKHIELRIAMVQVLLQIYVYWNKLWDAIYKRCSKSRKE